MIEFRTIDASHIYVKEQELDQLSGKKRSSAHLLPCTYVKRHVRYISATSETELRLIIAKIALQNSFILSQNIPVWGDVRSNPKVLFVSKQDSVDEEKKDQTSDEVDYRTQGEEEEEDNVEWPNYSTFRPLKDGSIIMIERSILHRDLKTTRFELYKRKIASNLPGGAAYLERSESRQDADAYTNCTNYYSERCGFLKKP